MGKHAVSDGDPSMVYGRLGVWTLPHFPATGRRACVLAPVSWRDADASPDRPHTRSAPGMALRRLLRFASGCCAGRSSHRNRADVAPVLAALPESAGDIRRLRHFTENTMGWVFLLIFAAGVLLAGYCALPLFRADWDPARGLSSER